MELHVGGFCWGAGWSKRKQTAGFFLERPKGESESISRVSQYIQCLCGTCWISMHAAALECVGVFSFRGFRWFWWAHKRSHAISEELWGKLCKFHRRTKTIAHFELPWMCISRFSQSKCVNRFFCSSQGAEEICYLRSQFIFPNICLFRVVLSDCCNLYEIIISNWILEVDVKLHIFLPIDKYFTCSIIKNFVQ